MGENARKRLAAAQCSTWPEWNGAPCDLHLRQAHYTFVIDPQLEADIETGAALNAGRLADPMLGTPADGRHPDHVCEQQPCPHIDLGAALNSDKAERVLATALVITPNDPKRILAALREGLRE